ncbi:MAG: hypothetical protein IPM69_11785 [Ignavibacteria bacterium]|nr:hypothetical protein [Ignavibacteria bacterium]
MPSETAGPFPLDLSENTFYLRQDVRETQPGVQLNIKLKIVGTDNCLPMRNARVNIWHCSKDGLYSGYGGNNNPGQEGLTYCRGYQMTDANGEVSFITVFPGWYPGRVCHIHFQVHVSTSYSAVSQLAFDHATTNALYLANPSLYPKGADPLSPQTDNIFADGYVYQVATLTPNASGAYDSYLEVAVQGSGTVGIGNEEKETAKQFIVEQNYPNPYITKTSIPFTLMNQSDVTIGIWSFDGKNVATIPLGDLSTGSHTTEINVKELGLAIGSYLYQVEVTNSNGIFKKVMMMSSGR